jgi:hypothetical protein
MFESLKETLHAVYIITKFRGNKPVLNGILPSAGMMSAIEND